MLSFLSEKLKDLAFTYIQLIREKLLFEGASDPFLFKEGKKR